MKLNSRFAYFKCKKIYLCEMHSWKEQIYRIYESIALFIALDKVRASTMYISQGLYTRSYILLLSMCLS